MLKINYPVKGLSQFHQKYINTLDVARLNTDLKAFFNSDPKFFHFRSVSVEDILIMRLEQLFQLSEDLNAIMNDAEKERLKLFFNYDKQNEDKAKIKYKPKQQPHIAKFYTEAVDLNLTTCFFCNIDFINIINDSFDYLNWVDFYKRATTDQLGMISNIGPKAVLKLVHGRENGLPISRIGLNKKQLQNFYKLEASPEHKHNHFTLDHLLDKATHPIAALSLYNLIPSCYSCNSKFKGSTKLVKTAATARLSPTSSSFSFSEKIRFKVYFPFNPKATFLDIKSVGDFVLDYEIDKDATDYEGYINAFKLRSRYIFHKNEVVKIVLKRKKYSNTQISEIAELTNQSEEMVKRHLFGEELFSQDHDYSPLTKFKRDIAKGIGIDGVV